MLDRGRYRAVSATGWTAKKMFNATAHPPQSGYYPSPESTSYPPESIFYEPDDNTSPYGDSSQSYEYELTEPLLAEVKPLLKILQIIFCFSTSMLMTTSKSLRNIGHWTLVNRCMLQFKHQAPIRSSHRYRSSVSCLGKYQWECYQTLKSTIDVLFL